jgi:hypothetical protein
LRFDEHRRQASDGVILRWTWGGSLGLTLCAQHVPGGPRERQEDAAAPRGFRPQLDHFGGARAVDKVDLAAAGAALGRARAGALAAVKPAPAVLHRRLPTGVPAAGLGAAARGGGVVA